MKNKQLPAASQNAVGTVISKNKKKITEHLKNNALYYLLLALMAMLVMGGAFEGADNRMKDALYQQPAGADPAVYVIGIDGQTLSAYGNRIEDWGRGKLAEMIELLNSDPETAPAVIGIDICFTGEVQEEAAFDTARLAEAVQKAGNVILAEQAVSGISIIEDAESGFAAEREVQYFDTPCTALSEAALAIGHCNMFLDDDTVARHGLGSFLADGEKHSSFSYQVFRNFAGREDSRFDEPGGRFLIDYSGKPGEYYGSSFAGSSFLSVLEGTYPKEVFSGAVVLIGAYAMGLRDSYQASVGGTMHGVEIHANMVSQMLEGRYKTELPLWAGAGILLLLGALVLFVCKKTGEKTGVILSLAAAVFYILFAYLLYRTGVAVLPLFAPVLTVIVLIVAGILLRFARSLVERRLMLERFSRYLAPVVAARLSDTSGSGTFPLKEADIAVMFVDVHSFTTISEAIGLEVVSMLQNFFDTVLESAFRYEGTCDKMIGDCAMLLFGAPLPVEDYEYKAVLAALDMKKKIEDGAVKVDLGNGPEPVTIGIGIACGSVMCGEMGSGKYRVEYTAIGNTVNTASRIEGQAGINEVLISEDTCRRLKGRIICEEKGSYRLKGKLHEEKIYSVIGVNE